MMGGQWFVLIIMGVLWGDVQSLPDVIRIGE